MSKTEKIVIVSLLAACLFAMAVIPLVSYLEYDARLQKYLESNKKEDVTDPVLVSLDLALADGTEFFANGKASPVKSNFVLSATYSIGVDTYVDEVSADKYSLEVPDDFSQNGGTVKATFEDQTASVDITLTPVKLIELRFVEQPYIVCYKENDTFSPDGMVLEAVYNDKTVIAVGNDYTIDDDKMTIGKDAVTATFERDGEQVSLRIPVTVMKSSEFTNGKLMSVVAEEEPVVGDGELIAQSKFTLRGTFESGNRIVLSASDYNIANGDKTAIFGKKSKLELIFVANDKLKLSLPLSVYKRTEAENGTVVGGKVTTGNAYVYDGQKYVLDKEISFVGSFAEALKAGEQATLTMQVSVPSASRGAIRLRVANKYLIQSGDAYVIGNLQLNNIICVYVNGARKTIGDDVTVYGVPTADELAKAANAYSEVTIDGVNFMTGDNVVKIVFENSGVTSYDGSVATIDVDCVDVLTDGDEISLTLSDFVKYMEQQGKVPVYKIIELERRMIVGGHENVSGACTDGEYLYYSFVGKNNKKCYVVKYKLGEGVVAKTEAFDLHNVINEDGSDGWWYLRGNIGFVKGKIVCLGEGFYVTVDPETMRVVGNIPLHFAELEELYKQNPEQVPYTINYNAKLDRYAVTVKEAAWGAWVYLYIYDGEFNLIKGNIRLACHEDVKWGGFELRTTFSNDDYIYAVSSFSYSFIPSEQGNNSKYDDYRYKAMVQLVDWDGNVDNVYEIPGFNATGNNYNHVMSVVEMNGKLYVCSYDNGGLNGGYLYEVTMSLNESGGDVPVPDKPIFSGKTLDWNVSHDEDRPYLNGSVSDGTYVFLAFADTGSKSAVVEKYTLEGVYLGKSDVITLSQVANEWLTDSAALFDCGDKVRLIRWDGSSVLVDKETLAVESDTAELPSSLPSELSDNIIASNETKYWLLGYAENAYGTRKVALIREGLWNSDFKLFVYDSDNQRVNGTTADNVGTSGRNVRDMAVDDDYIYVICGRTGAKDYSIFVFDWDGKLLKEIVVTDLLPQVTNPGSHEVQSMFVADGKIYVCTYDGSGHVYQLTFVDGKNMTDILTRN